jgi:hypothetical protein
LALVAVVVGCGASTQPSKVGAGENSQGSSKQETAQQEASQQETMGVAPAPPAQSPPADASQGDDASAEDPDQRQTRDVRYHVMPEGLRVRVAGVSLVPQATALKLPGGWGVRMTVRLSAEDEKPHVLLSPDQGPLAVFARITRRGKQVTSSDPRRGDGQQFITPGAPLDVVQEWPGRSTAKPLTAGDELELEVGLWGIGASATSHRPLKKFFRLKMAVGKGTPQPLVSAPETP